MELESNNINIPKNRAQQVSRYMERLELEQNYPNSKDLDNIKYFQLMGYYVPSNHNQNDNY